MSLILALIVLMGVAVFTSIIFNKKIDKTIILSFFIAIFIIYIFGFFDHLKAGVYAVIALSCLMWISSIILFFRKDKKEIIHNIVTPGMIIFGILTIVMFVFERGKMLVEWDEFSHWGSVVKSMFLTNGLSVKEGSSLMFKSYPPAISIFEYFFQVINR